MWIKHCIAWLLIVLMSLNSFAAIVGDSDGGAFVTKQEFEALKKNLAEQITNYNTSLDNKIDGKIAEYLSGARVANREKANVLNNSWKEVSAVNGAFANTYQVPDVDLLFGHGSMHDAALDLGQPTSKFYYIVEHGSRIQYKKNFNSTGNVYRNLVVATGSGPTDMGNLIWDGRALRYRETWNISRVVPNWPVNSNQWAYLDRPDITTYSIEMVNFYTLTGSGLITDWDSVKTTRWPVGYKWIYSTNGGSPYENNITFPSANVYDSFRTSIELEANSEGKTKMYDHIISYNGDDDWEVYNKDWNTLANVSANSSIYANNLKSTATTTSKGRVYGLAMHTGATEKSGVPRGMQDVTITQTTTNNAKIPSLGLISATQNSSDIYQDDVKKNIYLTDKVTTEKKMPKLHEGFQLLAAMVDEEIIWEPVFNYTHVHNSATTYTDNNHEVDIYFSYGPFTNNVSTSHPIKVTVDNGTVLKDYATTDDLKCKVKFTAPETGIIYVKWVPHNAGTYLNSDWIVTLNLEKCKEYIYTRE